MNDESQATQAKPSPEAGAAVDAPETPQPAAPEAQTNTPPQAATPPAPEPPSEGATDATESGDAKASERIRIGTQREAGQDAPVEALRPKPVHSVTEGEAPSPQGKSYPPPNVRQQLSDEEQAEFDALVEGSSVESVLDSAAAAAPAELAPETKLKGKVISVTADSVMIDLGNHQQGVVPLKQFEPKASPTAPAIVPADKPAEAPAEGAEAPAEDAPKSHAPEIGAEIDVVVARLNADEGIYEMALPAAAIDIGNWDEVEVGQAVEVTITGKNKGGLECQVAGIRGFMPMGQISIYRVENAEEFVGQRLAAVITEANRAKRNLILSHRAIMERERASKKEELLKELAPGQVRDGVVRSLRDFGAFVDLGGVDGLVHVSKLSWKRIHRTSDVLSEGQDVEAKVLSVDRNKQRIALSLKALMAAPAREEKVADEDMPLPKDAPKAPRKVDKNLKGGIGGPSGGEKFGLKW